MKVSVVVPNWNGSKLLQKNLPFVLGASPFEVIVVDDGSVDDSVSVMGEKFPLVRIVKHPKNMGFAKSCNDGVLTAQGDLVVLLNNDVKPEHNFISAILPHFGKDNTFAVSLGEELHSWAKASFDGFVKHGPGEREEAAHISFWASGGSAAFSKEKWLTLGGFDEIFRPFYWEDIDLSYRAWKRGWVVLWEPHAEVVHEHESTIGTHFSRSYINFISERNQLLFIWKNITDLKLSLEHRKALIKRLIANPSFMKPTIAALFKLPEVLKKRDKEEKEAKLPDAEIFAKFYD